MVKKYLGEAGTKRLIEMFKSDLDKKCAKFQFTELPSALDYLGKIVQYVGISSGDYINGYFYYSNGSAWTQINVQPATEAGDPFVVVDTLPSYDTAVATTIYFVRDGLSLSGYIKNVDMAGEFYELAGTASEFKFEIVAKLPTWTTAKATTIYFIKSGDQLTGYIKDDVVPNHFYEMAGGSKLDYEVVSSLPTWSDAKEDTFYLLITDVAKLEVSMYLKAPTTGKFYSLSSSKGNIEYVDALPAYADAETDTLYVVNESGILNLYTKAPAAGKFNALLGHEGIPIDDIDDAFDEIFN